MRALALTLLLAIPSLAAAKPFDRSMQMDFIKTGKAQLKDAGIKAKFSPSLKDFKKSKGPVLASIRVTVKHRSDLNDAFKILNGGKKGFEENTTYKNKPKANMISSEFGSKKQVQFSVGTKTGFADFDMNSYDD
jgi:hypothetical protein